MPRPELEAQVKAVNKANQYANELYARLAPIFEPLVGSNVLKVDGSLQAKYQKLLPKFPNTIELNVYFSDCALSYSLTWVVETYEMIKGGCGLYHKASVSIGDLNNGKLVKIVNRPNYRDDYKAEDVEAAQLKTKEAKKVYEELKSALFPFGE